MNQYRFGLYNTLESLKQPDLIYMFSLTFKEIFVGQLLCNCCFKLNGTWQKQKLLFATLFYVYFVNTKRY